MRVENGRKEYFGQSLLKIEPNIFNEKKNIFITRKKKKISKNN